MKILKMEDHNLMEDDFGPISHDEKTMATLAHLGAFFGFVAPGMGNILVPFLIWVLKKEESEYISEHAKEALNFQITMSICFLIGAVSLIMLIGFIALPILLFLDIIFSISAAVKANRGEDYEYPLNFRFIK